MTYDLFQGLSNSHEKSSLSFIQQSIFLGIIKQNTNNISVVTNLNSSKAMGCNMFLKIHFLNYLLDFLSENLADVSNVFH